MGDGSREPVSPVSILRANILRGLLSGSLFLCAQKPEVNFQVIHFIFGDRVSHWNPESCQSG